MLGRRRGGGRMWLGARPGVVRLDCVCVIDAGLLQGFARFP